MKKNSWTSDNDARWSELIAPLVREKLIEIGAWPTRCEYAKVKEDENGCCVRIEGGAIEHHERSRRKAFERIRSEIKYCIIGTTPDLNGNLCAYLRFEVGDETEDIVLRWQIDHVWESKRKHDSFADIYPFYRSVQFHRDLKKELNTIARSKKREEKLFATAGREKLEKQQLSSSLLAMKGKKQKI